MLFFKQLTNLPRLAEIEALFDAAPDRAVLTKRENELTYTPLHFPTILMSRVTQQTLTGSTAETAFSSYSVTIPANTLQAGMQLLMEIHFTTNINGNNKTIRFRLGGSAISSIVANNNGNFRGAKSAAVRSLNQIVYPPQAGVALHGTSNTGNLTASINLAQDQVFTITGQLANAADNIVVESAYLVAFPAV